MPSIPSPGSQGLDQGGPGDQAGPSADPRDTGMAGSQQGRAQAQPERPSGERPAAPRETGRPASPPAGQARGETPTERGEDAPAPKDRESPTGGDPRSPDIPGT